MLVAEDKMTEGDGLLLTYPGRGLGYQLAGAYRRLGRRTVSLSLNALENEDLKFLPAKHLVHDWTQTTATPFPGQANEYAALFLTPHPQLGLNQALTDRHTQEMAALARAVTALNPNLHVIAVVPKNTVEKNIRALRESAAKATVFLSPAMYGFRDGGLMEMALQKLKSNPSELLREVPAGPSIEAIYSGDLAGLIATVPGQARFFGKTLELPTVQFTLEEWRRQFVAQFKPRAPWFARLNAKFSSPAIFERIPLQQSVAPHVTEKTDDYFPVSLTPLDRVLRKAAEQFSRNPGLELAFPPPRAL